MGKKRAKPIKEAKSKEQMPNVKSEEEKEYVGLPGRDLKKNLGCG